MAAYKKTKWESKFRIIERYIEIKEFIDEHDSSLIVLLPTPQENLRILDLFEKTKTMHSITTAFQGNLYIVKQDFLLMILYTRLHLHRAIYQKQRELFILQFLKMPMFKLFVILQMIYLR
jgi:hypothetical protein